MYLRARTRPRNNALNPHSGIRGSRAGGKSHNGSLWLLVGGMWFHFASPSCSPLESPGNGGGGGNEDIKIKSLFVHFRSTLLQDYKRKCPSSRFGQFCGGSSRRLIFGFVLQESESAGKLSLPPTRGQKQKNSQVTQKRESEEVFVFNLSDSRH